MTNTEDLPRLWWLSFADEASRKNLGVCIVFAVNIADALSEAWKRKINPGGQVMIMPIDPAEFENRVKPEWINRLIPREEALAIVQSLETAR